MQRRDFLRNVGLVIATAVAVPSISFAADGKKHIGKNALSYKDALAAITGGKKAQESSKIHLKAPNIAENGAVVPVTVRVDSPMTESDYVKAIHILNTKNGNTRCIDMILTPANGKAMLATRIKLGSSQDVVAIAALSNGDYIMASQNVKVTIGGCG